MFKPNGIYPAMATPFHPDGSLNEQALRQYVDFQITGGLHGLFPVSSTGEGVCMEHALKCRCMDIVVEQTAGRLPVVPGIVAADPRESIRLARHARQAGCEAVVITPPYFFKADAQTVQKYIESIISAVDLPVVLYNIPTFAQPLSYQTVKELARLEQVVGMKDSSGNMVDFVNFLDAVRDSGRDVAMLTGREETLFACLAMGADGCMTATASVLPEIMVGIYNSYTQGDLTKAREMQCALLESMRLMASLPFPVGYKLGLELRGIAVGTSLLPLSDAASAQLAPVREKLRAGFARLLEIYAPGAKLAC